MKPTSRCLTLALFLAAVACADPVAAGPPPRFPPLTDEEAWKRLPPEKQPPLPAWARTLAGSLPRTTALMLELDHLHRTRNPLGAELRGRLRWVVADANRSGYGKKYAEFDLLRAGLGEKDLRALADPKHLSDADRAALAFARKLTLKGHAVTDDEVATLIEHFGPATTVAIVHTVAYANFQDRILLGLGVEVEPGGPLPPVAVRFDPKAAAAVPSRPAWAEQVKGKFTFEAMKPEWADHSFDELQAAMQRQKARKPRVPLPSDEALAHLPAEARQRARRIVWTHVSMGYQPALTRAWFDCMSAFQEEGKLDRAHASTAFWVITRTIDCFY